MTTSPPPDESPPLTPQQEALNAAANRLQAELETVENGELRAMYLHELGLLLERLGDDPSAARFYKESYNSAPGFREPLEALVAVFRRRGTYKNLGRLLEELSKLGSAGETPEAEQWSRQETARGRVELAAYQLDQQGDAAAARATLLDASVENPDDLASWLELELLAAKEGDGALRQEVLRERAARADSPLWRALLLLDLAELKAAGGDLEGAAAACREAAALEGAGRFRAQVVLSELARRERDDALLAEALEAQADLIERALEDSAAGDAEGVPRFLRSQGRVADLLLRSSEARRRKGDLKGAQGALARATRSLPDALELTAAKLALADAENDQAASAEVAGKLLESLKEGPEAASLWLRVAQAARLRGDAPAAISAMMAAAKADPSSMAARTLLIDALEERRAEGDGVALASTLESAAEQTTDEAARAKLYVRAAWEWALSAKDTTAAKAALSMATSLGLPSPTAARLARTLAALAGDTVWYDESCRRVLQVASEGEQAGLWIELLLQRAERKDLDAVGASLEALTRASGGAWLGRVLGAYWRPLLADDPRALLTPDALDALAQTEQPASVLRGLSLAAAFRSHQAGDVAAAKKRLEGLIEADAGDLVAARYLSGLLSKEGDAEGAARVLEGAAAAAESEAQQVALSIEAALLLWRAGQRARSLEPLRFAHSKAPQLAGPLLAWASRGVSPDDPAERRRVLDMAQEGEEDRSTTSLERFGLDLVTGEADDARKALESVEADGQGLPRLAAALARVAWPHVQAERGQLEEALSLLGADGDAGAVLSAVERVRLARDIDESRPDYARQASVWAEISPSLQAGIEWLAAAIAAEDTEAEIGAHNLLASQLDGQARTAELAAAATVQWLTGGGLLPNLLPSTEPAAQALNLELAPAGCDPRRRSAALKGLGGAFGEAASVDAQGLAGWSDLAANEPAAAAKAFRKVLERYPDDFCSWEGLRSAAILTGDLRTQAEAGARLGDLVSDPIRSALFFEEAGILLLEKLGDEVNGEQALAAAFAQDPNRSLAFDRLFRRVRQRNQDDVLVDLAQRRLTVEENEREIVRLYWEQARVFHKQNQFESALDALSSVVMLEPNNLGAQVLYGDIYTKQGNWEEAAASFAQLAANTTAPPAQRQMAGNQAATIYEKRLNNVAKAVEVLSGLNKAGLIDPKLRERLAVLAAKGQAWSEATSMFETLMIERDTAEGRIEAARFAMVVWRDKVGSPKDAKRAVVRLLEEAPADAEALRLVLSTDFGASIKAHALGTGKSTLVQQLSRGALDPDAVALLSEVARGSDDAALFQAALGVLVALGRDTPAISDQLASLDSRAAKVPQIIIDSQVLGAIGDPADSGPVIRLFEALGEIIAEALGPTKDALNVGRKERIDARSGLPLRNDIAAWAGALGLGEFELYVGGRDPNGVQGVGGEVPALVVGANIKSPLSAAARQAIARELFALKRGTTVVRSRDEATVASIAVAACNLAGVRLNAPAFAILADVQRQLDKAMTRKVKKVLPELCQQTATSGLDVLAWARASQRSLDRIAAIAAGDVSLVLADIFSAPRGELRRHVSNNDRAERLLRFVLSPQYLELRNHLGMGVR